MFIEIHAYRQIPPFYFCTEDVCWVKQSLHDTHDCALKNHFKAPNQFILYKLSPGFEFRKRREYIINISY